MKRFILWVLVFVCGMSVGILGRVIQGVLHAKDVVIRVGNLRSEVDYDLQAAINYLVYRLEESGYRVLGKTYNGDLYPGIYDGAGVNVFVRGFLPFYDARMNKNGKNLFYIHRTDTFYEEELQHYDGYLFSQQALYNVKKTDIPAVFFEGGAVPHERLEPQYEYDVLYIYEDDRDNFSRLLQNSLKVKIFNAMSFAALSTKEREKELSRARVVMYQLMPNESEVDYDAFYVPYAVYDIMSYGRPLVTNRRLKLEEKFKGKIWLYDGNLGSRIRTLQEALGVSDVVREGIAAKARVELFKDQSDSSVLRW